MFERSIRLRQAEEAFAQGRWEEALFLAGDPLIARHRRALEVTRKARQALLERARARMEGGDARGARRDVQRAGGDATLAGWIAGQAEDGPASAPSSPTRSPDPLQPGLILRVAGAGDLLVLPQGRLLIGSVANPAVDLGLLARLGREHAELLRDLRFHKGMEHRIRALEGQPVTVNGARVDERVLEPEDLVGLGPVVQVRFLRPVPGSATPLLLFDADFEVDGCRRVAWLKCPGWDGGIRLGCGAENHIRVPGVEERLEFALDRQHCLLVRGTRPLTIDGTFAGPESAVVPGQEVRCGDLTVFVDHRPRRGGRKA